VVVVSQRLAERLWPDRDPIGQRLQFQSTTQADVWLTVVGVAGPVLHHELEGQAGFDMYQFYGQSLTAGPYYVVRTGGDSMTIARAATAIIGDTDPNQSFLDVHSYGTRVANRIWPRRLAGALFGSFASVAMLLASIGLYGVLSYMVNQQTREIGVRVALGASSGGIIGQVLGRGLKLAVIGIIAGTVLAVGLTRQIAGMFYEVSATDPATFLSAPLILLLIAAGACYVPARRATRVDPIVLLRAE
jgi:putative ABC transport system permease protein